jgi:hypothetical protein
MMKAVVDKGWLARLGDIECKVAVNSNRWIGMTRIQKERYIARQSSQKENVHTVILRQNTGSQECVLRQGTISMEECSQTSHEFSGVFLDRTRVLRSVLR